MASLSAKQAKVVKHEEYLANLVVIEGQPLVDTLRSKTADVTNQVTGEVKTRALVNFKALVSGEKVNMTVWSNTTIFELPSRGEAMTLIVKEHGLYTPSDGSAPIREFWVDTMGCGNAPAKDGFRELQHMAVKAERISKNTGWITAKVIDPAWVRIRGGQAVIAVKVVESQKPDSIPVGEYLFTVDADNPLCTAKAGVWVKGVVYHGLPLIERNEKGQIVAQAEKLYYRRAFWGTTKAKAEEAEQAAFTAKVEKARAKKAELANQASDPIPAF
jgi:hypothetical protein